MIRILSIDGGGIRGILPGQILVALEAKLQKKTNNTNARLADFFDLMAGTSTGGILTCLYLCPDPIQTDRPKFSAKQAVELYLQHGHTIFNASIARKLKSAGGLMDEKYNAHALEERLLTYFADTKLSELLKPCTIPSYDIFHRNGHFFASHDAIHKEGYDFFVRDVARSTSAAPSYFEPANIHSTTQVSYPLVDGGIFANNPAMCAYAEARLLFKKKGYDKGVTARDMFLVSIGTGHVKKPYEYEKARTWGAIGWLKPALDIMMSGVAETVDFQLKQLFDADDALQNYVRLEPNMGQAGIDMDDASEHNLAALKEAGTLSAEQMDETLDLICETLCSLEKNTAIDQLV